MKIKKLFTVFMVLMLAGSPAACGRSNEKHRETESAGQSNISSEPSQKVETNQSEGTEQGNILIAYFSQFGNTGYPDDIDASTSASVVLDGLAAEAEDVPSAQEIKSKFPCQDMAALLTVKPIIPWQFFMHRRTIRI